MYRFLQELQGELEANVIKSIELLQGSVDILCLVEVESELELLRIHHRISQEGRIQRVITLRAIDPSYLEQIAVEGIP